jgi:putative membrane protein
MKIRLLVASAALAVSACGGGADEEGKVDANLVIGAEGGNVALPGNEAAAAGQTAVGGQQYVELAGGSDLYEIESARLALEKAQRSEVRELAQMILNDHERSTRELTSAARQAQPALTVSPQMNTEQQANIQALRSANGAAFDQAWLDQQVQAHEKALTLVTGYAQSGDVPSLRQHAGSVAGPIQQHLTRARELQTAQ